MKTLDTSSVQISQPADETLLITIRNSQQLDRTRAELSRKLNGLQSTTRVLAPEILSLIFQYVCARPKIRLSLLKYRRPLIRPIIPFILSHVCFHWRQVVWSTAKLWTRLIAAPRGAKQLEYVVTALEVFRTNVRQMPFILGLDLRGIQEGRDHLIKAICHQELGPKIRILHLSPLGHTWPTFFSHQLRQLTNLIDLRIDGSGSIVTSSEEYSLAEIPSLRKLSVSSFNVVVKLPSDSLTTLYLHRVDVSICIGLLTQCPNLIALRASGIDRLSDGDHNAGHSQISSRLLLGYLKELSWQVSCDGGIDEHFCKTVLHRFEFPSLRTFSWDASFLYRFSQTQATRVHSITTLSLSGIEMWADETVELVEETLVLLRGLEHLSLLGCYQGIVHLFLRKLAWSFNQQLSPALRALTISQLYEPLPNHFDASEGCRTEHCSIGGQEILKILKPRWQAGVCRSFHIALLRHTPVTFCLASWRELQELIASGFEIQVTDGSGGDLLFLYRPDDSEEEEEDCREDLEYEDERGRLYSRM